MHIKINKKTITIFISVCMAVVFLMAAVISLATEGSDKRDTIEKLNAQVSLLEQNLTYYKTLHQDIIRGKDYRQFQNKAFQIRFPNFSETIKIVYKKSIEYGFNPYLVMAIIQVESSFNPTAVSHAGAYGLMQVNYSAWKDQLNIAFEKIFEKEYNIELGLKILKYYYDHAKGNIFTALSRYCTGDNPNFEPYNKKITSSRYYAQMQTKGILSPPPEQDDKSM